MPVKPRGSSFEATIHWKGKRYRFSFPSLKEAEGWESDALAALKNDRDVPTPKTAGHPQAPATVEGFTLKSLLESTRERVWRGTKSGDDLYDNAVRVVEILGPMRHPATVNTPAVEELIEKLKKLRNSNATINRKLSALRVMLKHAVRKGILTTLPLIDRLSEGKGRTRFYTEDEELAIINWFTFTGDLDMADLTATLIDTGMRLSEALKLNWPQVHFKQGVISVLDRKSGNSDGVPMTDRVSATLARRKLAAPQGEGPFKGLTKDSTDSRWSKMRSAIGMGDDKQFVIHTLRHTCASRLVQRGIDLLSVKEWLGHSSIAVTQRYAHLMPGRLLKVKHVLEPGGSAGTMTG